MTIRIITATIERCGEMKDYGWDENKHFHWRSLHSGYVYQLSLVQFPLFYPSIAARAYQLYCNLINFSHMHTSSGCSIKINYVI